MSLQNGIVNGLLRHLGFEIRRYRPHYVPGCVRLHPEVPSRGTVLLAYILEPFKLRSGESIPNRHNHNQESILMAQVWLSNGYTVDVIDYRNDKFVPGQRYDYFVSARVKLEVIASRLNKDCIKIAHFDTSHFVFNNYATYARLMDMQRRRGVSVAASARVMEHSQALEVADYCVVLGDAHTVETYDYLDKPLFMLPAVSTVDVPWDSSKDFQYCRNRFIWLGSNGLVHKGLDIVLEAFAEMPEMQLTVCGPLQRETQFCEIYHRELYETANIQVAGWVEMPGEKFRSIASEHVAIVYPSCAEGQATAVLNTMGAGMIPVVSRAAGIPVGDFGFVLEDVSVESVRDTVHQVAALPPEDLATRAKLTWQYAQTHHSCDAYKREYGKIVEKIITTSR